MSKLAFSVLKTKGNARLGELSLGGVTLTTPVFMPVGTKATIKSLPLEFLSDHYLGTQDPIKIILANTFHLYLRPGADTIHQLGGLHQFQQRDGLILTDSGGFQIFSLGLGKQGKKLVKLFSNHVEFSSPYDGSKHVFTPTGVIDIQRQLGSNIMTMLDICSPVKNISKYEVAQQMNQTHRRAEIQYDYHHARYEEYPGVLFPIIQGGIYPDLRRQSAEHLSQFATDGIAIGGLSVGETKEEMYTILQGLQPHLPDNKPRYLMGVGTPEDLREAIYQGVDMFDCVMPTRLARHGSAFTQDGTVKLSKSTFSGQQGPLEHTCTCHTCRNFAVGYLHHLVKEKEMLGATLLTLHNISYLHQITEKIKQEILAS